MRFGYASNNAWGLSQMVGQLSSGLRTLGHSADPFLSDETYDYVILECTDVIGARWPNYLDRASRVIFIDWNEYGPMYTSVHSRFDFCNAFTPKCFARNQSPATLQRVHDFLCGRSFLYFSRELFKEVDYPDGYHAIDCAEITDVALSSEQEFLARKNFLFVCMNNSHPHRRILADVMLEWARERDVPHYVVCSSEGRLDRPDFYAGLSSAQVSVSYCGRSISDNQVEILRRCCLVRNTIPRLRPVPLDDGCVEYECALRLGTCDGQDFLKLEQTNLKDVLTKLYADKHLAYETYRKGCAYAHANYTPVAIARYVLDKIEKHDWNKPTDMDVRRFCRGEPVPMVELRQGIL